MKKIFVFLSLLFCSFCIKAISPESSTLTMLVGTYTSGSSVGIYTYRFNSEDLSVQPLSQVEVDTPSFLAISSNNNYVYAASESGNNSAVSAFAFNKDAGTLKLLNKKLVGSGPCNILFHEHTNTVLTANYNAGSVSITQVAADGSLTDEQLTLQYEGQSIVPRRQTSPHLHCVIASPDNKALYATDLGTDKIHKIDIKTPQNQTKDLNLIFAKSNSFEMEPGSGPRHIVFNQKNTFAYLINELSGMVSVFTINADNSLVLRQSELADTLNGAGSADIHLSPDEKFLYSSTRMRGEGEGIVVFSVNGDGTVKRIGFKATGRHPRNFAITPDGSRMLVACKDSGFIQIFNIDKQTGLLTDSGQTIPVDQPVCIKFVQ